MEDPPPSATWQPALRPNATEEPLFSPSALEAPQGESSAWDHVSGDQAEFDLGGAEPPAAPADHVDGLEAHGSNEESLQHGPATVEHKSEEQPAPAQDTMWSDKSDVDAAWGQLDAVNHTNSFPPVPPQDHPAEVAKPLAHSQLGDIMQNQLGIQTEQGQDATESDPWDSKDTGFGAGDDFFSKPTPVAEEVKTPADDEARFEEGLPLIPQEQESAQQQNATNEDAAFSFGNNADAGGDDFFSSLGSHGDNGQQPHPLARKSTEQVLSNMHFSAQPSKDAMDTINENSAQPTTEPGKSAKGDDDLAAMWEAALGDDVLDESMDPSSFFGDDDGGFLHELDQGVNAATSSLQSQGAQYAQPPSGISTASSYAAANYTSGSVYNRTQSPFETQPAQPPILERAQSYADKSKGGYSSPYDAPMDISRPRRQPLARTPQVITRGGPAAAPPPRRSDSMQSNYSVGTQGPVGYAPSPTMSQAGTMMPSILPSAAPVTGTPRPNSSGFFEELPAVVKPRPASSAARFVPPAAQQTPAPAPTPAGPPRPHQASQSLPSVQPNQFGLVGPEKIMPFAELSQPPPAQPAPASSSSVAGRYSPAPQSQQSQQQQAASARAVPPNPYATPSAAAGITRPPSVPHQYAPHKPSPLVRSASANQYRPGDQPADVAGDFRLPPGARRASLLRNSQTPEALPSQMQSSLNSRPRGATYRHPLEQSQIMSPDTREFDTSMEPKPQIPAPLSTHQEAANELDIPKRPQVQPRGPALVQTQARAPESYSVSQQTVLNNATRVRAPSLNTDTSFMPPTDNLAHDPLRRWQGAPILRFGFGGSVVTTFPKRIPRYAPGSRTPLIKCGAGEIRIQSAKILPAEEQISTFPGPLKSKSKKKDVLEWLRKGIQALEQKHAELIADQASTDFQKRHEEKILLWKILSVLVEHDGTVEGNLPAGEAIRNMLCPEHASDSIADQSLEPPSLLPNVTSPSSDTRPPVTPNVNAVEILRRLLLKGEREKAVWHAVDQKLWGHAMLISSTMPRDVWKQVAHEFVRNEVKHAGHNMQSLAALYDVFSGNWEESVDELVPPSARAGLQMMSKSPGTGPTRGGVEGLNRWRETLSLMLSNRSPDDPRSMVALGQLLASYGRFEAAHICYIFSRLPGIFGGPDDPQCAAVLLGTDHRQHPLDYAKDFDSVLLTEVYEFVYSTLCPASAPTFSMPHLQAFKLYHAEVLAELGLRDEAQQYCDAMASAFKATTNKSPYLHPRLFAAMDELNSRLRQATKEGSGSWISRPSMDKVSGSIFNRLAQFVAGDEGDDASVASGRADAEGPFAMVNGGTPPIISRGPSPAVPAYGQYAPGTGYTPGVPAMVGSNSRYAPGATGTTYAPQGQRAMPDRPSPASQGYDLLPGATPDASGHQHPPAPQPATALPTPPSVSKYSPEIPPQSQFGQLPATRVHEPQMSPPTSEAGNSRPSTGHGAYAARENLLSPKEHRHSPYQPSPTNDRYSPGYGPRSASSYGPRSASLEPKSASYEPMSASSQPRSYMPSPSLDAEAPSHPETYEPSAPIYGEYPMGSSMNEADDEAYPGADERRRSSDDRRDSYGYQASTSLDDMAPASGLDAPSYGGYQPSSAGYEPPSEGYGPPSAGYAPPSYDPAAAEEDAEEVKSPRKKKSFMDLSDDEDDLAARAAALKKKEKSSKDRDADDAFRRAAEADANRQSGQKSGWFGSIWGGKGGKDPKQAETKAHQIKLGEENSFYFDKELGKWVNKKGGADAAGPSAPTPPPPKGPPSRAVSSASGPPTMGKPPGAMGGPPSAMASRNTSPSMGLTSPPGAAGGLVPPSRPGTGMSGISNASSIDDLIGVPQARKGGTVKKGKKGRGYVDVMAK